MGLYEDGKNSGNRFGRFFHHLQALKVFLLFLIAFNPINAQYQQKQSGYVIHKDWTCERCGFYGSFYWQVKRTSYKDSNGLYWYYIYFYSNSYLTSKNPDGSNIKAISYITNPTIYMENTNMTISQPYILCDWTSTYVGYFSAPHINKVKVEYTSVVPYYMSKKR